MTFLASVTFVTVIFFGLFLIVFLLFTVPLNSTLVRLRANYNPKGLQLDPEDGVQPHTGPVVTGFFAMMKRIRRLEVRFRKWLRLTHSYNAHRVG